jgi:hypothetical protein
MRLHLFEILRRIAFGATVQVVTALVVAVLGAWLAYWFSKRGDRNKLNRELASLLPELDNHAHRSALELDGVIVPWPGRQTGRGVYTSGTKDSRSL